MRAARSSLIIILIAFVALLLQSVFSRFLAHHPWGPYLTLPFVFALAEAPGVHRLQGAFTSFVLGYMYDAFSGNPLGIYSFVFVLGYLVARLACWRLSFRGPAFEIVLSFVLTLALGALVAALRDWMLGVAEADLRTILSWFATALVTALISPMFFAIVRAAQPEALREQL
jgi:rod shape-determining protein MreD